MKPLSIDAKIARPLSWAIAAILVLLPFHAFITVWLSSAVGHYTLLRLWKEFLLVPIVLGALYFLVTDSRLRKRLFSLKITWLIGVYILLLMIWGLLPLARHDVSAKAAWYGLLVDLRFLIFFLAVMVLAAKSCLLRTDWLKILLAPAIFVAAFAVLQYVVLPYDFLKHFGYGPDTIGPYETINNNINHIRVESTLRGANPLGAYLIMPISVMAVMFFREKAQRYNKALLSGGLLLALLFSFSRSAWLGTALSLAVIAWLCLKSERARKLGFGILVGILLLGGILTLLLRNNLNFENAIFHTDRASKIATSSNENHASAFKSAASDIYHHPLGKGVGTAGPQSVYNKDPGRISENYYLQIGQEAGVAGMLLFIAICTAVAKMLYVRRREPLALALFGALIGLSLVNLLSHAWSDDTLAYVYWGLAGIVLTPVILEARHKHNGKITKTAA